MTRLLQTFLAGSVKHGCLTIETADGRAFTVGDGTGTPLAITLTDRLAERRLLLDPALALGELYMDGRLLITRGTLYDLLTVLTANIGWGQKATFASQISALRQTLHGRLRRNSRDRARRNIAHHYDLDRRLYDLFLDPDRQYSCAYFEHPQQSLAAAQLAKKRHIAAKLIVAPGQHVLDIGSGWGGLAVYLATQCGADVTGITLSSEQLAASRLRAQKTCKGPKVDFRLEDFRDVSGAFDRIVSVGMFEHVGRRDYPTYFAKIHALLRDDGIALLHAIGRMDGPGTTNPWIAKYIFPGGYLPALSEVLPAIEQAGLVVTDIEILRLHYADTLKAWRSAFLARRQETLALYDERFCRMWEFYLAASECGFRFGNLMVFQIQVAKHQHAVPPTRDYITAREASLRQQEVKQSALLAAKQSTPQEPVANFL